MEFNDCKMGFKGSLSLFFSFVVVFNNKDVSKDGAAFF